MKYLFTVTPIGKPRMTQRDRWAKRDCVLRYYAFKDSIKEQATMQKFTPGDDMKVTFGYKLKK